MDDLPMMRRSIEFRNTYVDPLNLLQRSAHGLPGIRGIGVDLAADPILWFDTLCCVRSKNPGEVRRMAAAGEVVLWRWHQIELRLPLLGGGRVLIAFAGERPQVACEQPGLSVAAKPGAIELCAMPGGAPTVNVRVCGHRTRLTRVGVIVDLPVDADEPGFGDPLDDFADPITDGAPGNVG